MYVAIEVRSGVVADSNVFNSKEDAEEWLPGHEGDLDNDEHIMEFPGTVVPTALVEDAALDLRAMAEESDKDVYDELNETADSLEECLEDN